MATSGRTASGRDGALGTGAHPPEQSPGFREADLGPTFELLARVAGAVAATVGPDCEAVVHDLRNPEHSVVAISGHLTSRHVGSPIPDPELLPDRVDRFTSDDLRRRAVTSSGHELVASTVWVRNDEGHIVGALCINVDVAGLRRAHELIARRLGDEGVAEPVLPTFAATVPEFTRLAVSRLIGDGASRLRRLDPAERVELVRRLDAAGVFSLRGAARAVAAELGISRASLYLDLRSGRCVPGQGGRGRGRARPRVARPADTATEGADVRA